MFDAFAALAGWNVNCCVWRFDGLGTFFGRVLIELPERNGRLTALSIVDMHVLNYSRPNFKCQGKVCS